MATFLNGGTMQEGLTRREPLLSTMPGTSSGTFDLVTYPGLGEIPMGYRPFITNPEFFAELGLFLGVLTLGLVLMYAGSNEHPSMFEYGVIFFNAGVIPCLTSFIAPLVRNARSPDDLASQTFERREVLLYPVFVVFGILLILLDRNNFEEDEDGIEDRSFQNLIGGTLFEAGLIYVAIRFLLLGEAPQDQARRLNEEVEYLRESISKGIAYAYFLNFCKWLAKDMIRSRFENAGNVDYQPATPPGTATAQIPPNSVQEDIMGVVVVIPKLNESAFPDTGSVNNDILSAFQREIEQAAGVDAVRGSIRPSANNNGGRFTRAQNTLKLRVQDINSQPQRSVTVLVDIPSTLLTVATNVAQNRLYDTPEKRVKAYAREAELFSSQLVWLLKNTRDTLDYQQHPGSLRGAYVDFSDHVTVLEYKGKFVDFYTTLKAALLEHFNASSP